MEQILVTAAIIEKDGKILLTKRLDGVHREGKWEFPGGKVNIGENPKETIKREIREELGINIGVDSIFEISSYVYEDADKQVILMAFKCEFKGGDIEKKEVADYAWVKPEEMGKYDIVEADLIFVSKLKESKNF
jgi:8-oxo-dGTP diphosphatase